jgi:hypothetical protein
MRSAFVLLLFASSLAAQVPANLPPVSTFLKANSTIQQIATDAQGYIYVCGNVNPRPRTRAAIRSSSGASIPPPQSSPTSPI